MDTAIFKKRWVKNLLTATLAVCAVYIMIYVDVVARARYAYFEGEKYWRWNDKPEEKGSFLETKFNGDKTKLDKMLTRGKITPEEYQTKLEATHFDKEQALEESSLKYAYQWYKDTYELFSPPESRWVKLARDKAPLAKEKWKQELTAKGVKFEDYMLE